MDLTNQITEIAIEHSKVSEAFIRKNAENLNKLAQKCADVLSNGNKLLLCGNGGSACDAMHIAGEFTGRFIGERPSLPAISLTADSCALTAISNDYGYDEVFARQVEGLGNSGDVLIGITTSGNSANIIRAMQVAESKGLTNVTLLGKTGGKAKGMADFEFIVEHNETARIQECHMLLLHILCELIEIKMGYRT